MSVRRSTTALLALLLALCSAPAPRARAFSVENHERITELAIALVDRCRRANQQLAQPAPELGPYSPRLRRCAPVIKRINAGQDGWTRKLRLWHFRSADGLSPLARLDDAAESSGCPVSGPLRVICAFDHLPTFDVWLRHLWKQVAPGAAPETLYPALGATLHFIQDMAVPAHAVPVFHPQGLGALTDAVDDWPVSLTLEELGTSCSQLAPSGTLDELFARAQAATRESLLQPIEGAQTSAPDTPRWGLFWSSERKNSGDPRFGTYGCEQPFGSGRVTCSGNTYQIAQARYGEFAARRARQAVLDSAALIVLFERQLTRSDQTACESGDDDAWYPSKQQLGL